MGYVPYWRDTLLSTRWLKSDWKASEGEKQAYICWCFNKDIHCMFVEGSQEQSFFLQTLLFTAFVATVQKIITYALVSTWSWVSSGWEHVTRFMHHWERSTYNHSLRAALWKGRIIWTQEKCQYEIGFKSWWVVVLNLKRERWSDFKGHTRFPPCSNVKCQRCSENKL